MTTSASDLDTASAVLDHVRGQRRTADTAEVEILRSAVRWADLHPAESISAAAVLARYGDHAVAIAGPGAPLVAEFAVAEFAVALRLPTETGKQHLGEALELAYRLPKVWARVTGGDLQAWKARRIARATICLTRQAAAYVDAQVAGFAHKIGPAAVDRLVEEAICRYMPEEAARRRRQASDGRHVDIHTEHVSFEGTVWVEGQLDLADGIDLDTALSAAAAHQGELGCTEPLAVRRAIALGEMARTQLALNLNPEPPTTAEQTTGVSTSGAERPARPPETDPARPPETDPARPPETDPARPPQAQSPARPAGSRRARQVVLYTHLSADAVTSPVSRLHLARIENTGSFVDADQVREWCGNPDTQVILKPVIDLNEHIAVGAYEVPDRLAEQATLVDGCCVFPWCTRPARRLHPDRPDDHRADCDHAIEHNRGGPTCSCNIAALCRRHHRLKTHTGWGYTVLERGTYLWTSPHGYQFLRDHHGTLDVSTDRVDRPAHDQTPHDQTPPGHPPEPER